MILRALIILFLVNGALTCFGGGGYGDETTVEPSGNDQISQISDKLNFLKDNFNKNKIKDWKQHLNDYYDEGDDGNSDKKKMIENLKDPMERNLLSGFRNWTPSPKMREQWKGWLDEHNKRNNRTNIDFVDPNNPNEFDHERGPGSGFPQDWAGLGAGHDGVPPPPWAFVPRLTGKPMRCSLPLKVGKPCPDQTTSPSRFAYNPFLDKCVQFRYNGCFGNRNSFEKKLQCEQVCVIPIPFGGCDRESGIKIEDLINNLD